MINWALAIQANGAWVLTALAIFFLILAVVSLATARRQRVVNDGDSLGKRRINAIRMSLCALIVLAVSLIPWFGIVAAVRFDWDPHDAHELEILVFPSPDPSAVPERTITIKDGVEIGRVFDGLASLRSYQSSHEQVVGTRYVIRCQRLSDGHWSKYRVEIYSDSLAAGATDDLRRVNVYRVTLDHGWRNGPTLGTYQSLELGETVKDLVAMKREHQ